MRNLRSLSIIDASGDQPGNFDHGRRLHKLREVARTGSGWTDPAKIKLDHGRRAWSPAVRMLTLSLACVAF